jgi:uncharacterized protein (DUF736 family)
MTTIGAGWKKRDENDNPYISCSADEALLPLTIDKNKRLALYPIKEKKTENSPDFILDLFVPKKKEENNQTSDDTIWD